MATIPVKVGQLRRHPEQGHTLRVTKITGRSWTTYATCTPDPPVKGRRTTSIATTRLEAFDLVTTEPVKEPTP